jgi:hypothetical protein
MGFTESSLSSLEILKSCILESWDQSEDFYLVDMDWMPNLT